MDRTLLAMGSGARLGAQMIGPARMSTPTEFDAFLADIRAKTRHDINQAKRELLDGMHEFSSTAISAHCEAMATMSRAVEHSANAAAAAFERSFMEYRVELAKRDEMIATLRVELIHALTQARLDLSAELAQVAAQPVLSRWWTEFKRWLWRRNA